MGNLTPLGAALYKKSEYILMVILNNFLHNINVDIG